MPEILHELRIAATPEEVYGALTTPEGLAAWFTRDVVTTATVGSTSEFGFDNHQTVFRMEIVELVPAACVRWRCVGGHSEWQGTEVMFELEPADAAKATDLRFHHQRWLWRDGQLARSSYEWALGLASLKTFLESGTGTPRV